MNIAHVRAQTRIGSRHLLLLVAIAVYTWWIPVDFRDFREKNNHVGGSSRITWVCPQSIGDTPISVVLPVRYKFVPGVACTDEVGCSHEHDKNSANTLHWPNVDRLQSWSSQRSSDGRSNNLYFKPCVATRPQSSNKGLSVYRNSWMVRAVWSCHTYIVQSFSFNWLYFVSFKKLSEISEVNELTI